MVVLFSFETHMCMVVVVKDLTGFRVVLGITLNGGRLRSDLIKMAVVVRVSINIRRCIHEKGWRLHKRRIIEK